VPADPVPVPTKSARPETARPETTRPETARPVNTEQGGDPVCWMHLLCPACGAMPDPEQPEPGICPRCGEERER
jgi:hypothetical protein